MLRALSDHAQWVRRFFTTINSILGMDPLVGFFTRETHLDTVATTWLRYSSAASLVFVFLPQGLKGAAEYGTADH